MNHISVLEPLSNLFLNFRFSQEVTFDSITLVHFFLFYSLILLQIYNGATKICFPKNFPPTFMCSVLYGSQILTGITYLSKSEYRQLLVGTPLKKMTHLSVTIDC